MDGTPETAKRAQPAGRPRCCASVSWRSNFPPGFRVFFERTRDGFKKGREV
jgi:hypothetical protein